MPFFWSEATLRIPTAIFGVSLVACQRVRELEELVIVTFKGPWPESIGKPSLLCRCSCSSLEQGPTDNLKKGSMFTFSVFSLGRIIFCILTMALCFPMTLLSRGLVECLIHSVLYTVFHLQFLLLINYLACFPAPPDKLHSLCYLKCTHK